ncbi:MAG: hypothetical protein ABW213_13345 [Tardiphaga sp.]
MSSRQFPGPKALYVSAHLLVRDSIGGASGGTPMSNRDKQIQQIETRAAESKLIVDLATNPETRAYNSRLSEELSRIARSLRDPAALDAAACPDASAFDPAAAG